MFTRIFLMILFLALSACRAEEVEVQISSADLAQAIKGEVVWVPFEAKFENLGPMDEEQKTQIDLVRHLVEKRMQIEEFEVSSDGSNTVIEIEGELPMSTNLLEDAPWQILLYTNPALGENFVAVQIDTGKGYNPLKKEISAISYMLEPERYHPTKFKLKADGLIVMAPAAEADGKTHLLYISEVKRRMSIKFLGEPFEKVGAGFYFIKDSL